MTKGRVPKKLSEAGCDARDLVPLAPIGPVIAMYVKDGPTVRGATEYSGSYDGIWLLRVT